MTSRSASELMNAVAEHRDRQAFAALFAEFGPRLKAYVMRYGAAPHEAEEVVQEVMLVVWRKAGSFDPSRSSVSTWLFTIARNKRIDAFRKDKRPELDPSDPAMVPPSPTAADEAVDLAQRGEAVREALAELPDDQRAVLHSAYFEDKSMSAIAEERSIPVGTVKSRARLAMKRLREAFTGEKVA